MHDYKEFKRIYGLPYRKWTERVDSAGYCLILYGNLDSLVDARYYQVFRMGCSLDWKSAVVRNYLRILDLLLA